MPQALAGIIVGAIGLTGVAATIATAVIAIGISAGLAALTKAIFGTPGAPKPSDVQRTIRVNIGSRIRHYGIVHTGGQLTFEEAKSGTATFLSGKSTGALFQVVTTGHGQLSEILHHRLNNKEITVGVDGAVVGFRNMIRLYSRLGEPDQTAISELTAQFPQWTEDHRQRGCSHTALFFGTPQSKYFSDVYAGNTAPAYTCVAKAAMVYDPRKDSTLPEAGGVGPHRVDDPTTWEWSDNAALVWADYLAHPDGFGLGYDGVNWVNIAAEAQIADQEVYTVDDRTIKRWRIWGSYRLADDERRAVLQEMRKACDGFMWEDADGLVNIRLGRWIEPTVHLTSDHIKSVTGSLEGDPQERANEVRIIYTDPDFDYSEQESAPQIDVVTQAEVGQEIARYDCFYIPDHNQASRVGKRMLRQLMAEWHLTITANLYALNLIGERFCILTIEELGIEALTFEIETFRLDPVSNLVELVVHSAEEEDFAFNAETEEGSPPLLPGETDPTIELLPPEGLTLEAIVVSGGGVAVRATWDEGPIGLIYEAQYQPEDESSPPLGLIVDQDTRTATTGPVVEGTDLVVRVRAATPYGRVSEWAEETIVVPDAESIAKRFKLVADTVVIKRDAFGNIIPDQVVHLTGYRTNTTAPLIVRLYRQNNDGTVTQIDAGVYVDGEGTITDNDPDANSFTQTGDELELTGLNFELAVGAHRGVLFEVTCDGEVDRASVSALQDGTSIDQLLDAYLLPATFAAEVDAAAEVQSYAGASFTFVIETVEGVDVSANFTLATAENPQGLTVGYVGMVGTVTAGLDAGEDAAALIVEATGSGDYDGYTIRRTFTLTKDIKPITLDFLANANDRNALEPDAPVITTGPSLVQISATGVASAVMGWSFAYNADPAHENNIDFFRIGRYAAETNAAYTFGDDAENEVWEDYFGDIDAGTYAITVLDDGSPDVFYWFAVEPARTVHSDVDPSKLVRGPIDQTTSAWRPADDGGYAPIKRRLGTSLSGVTFATDGTALEHNLRLNGTADVRAAFTYGGSLGLIDGFECMNYQASSNAAYTPGTFPLLEQKTEISPASSAAIVIQGVQPTIWQHFAVRPFRLVDLDIDASGRIVGPWVKPSFTGENPYQPSTSVELATTVVFGGQTAGNVALWSTYASAGLNPDGTVKPDKVGQYAMIDESIISAGYSAQGATIYLGIDETFEQYVTATLHEMNGNRAVVDLMINWAMGCHDPDQGDVFSIQIRAYLRYNGTGAYIYSDWWTEEFTWTLPDATGDYFSPRKTSTFNFTLTGFLTGADYEYGYIIDCGSNSSAAMFPYRYARLQDMRGGTN